MSGVISSPPPVSLLSSLPALLWSGDDRWDLGTIFCMTKSRSSLPEFRRTMHEEDCGSCHLPEHFNNPLSGAPAMCTWELSL